MFFDKIEQFKNKNIKSKKSNTTQYSSNPGVSLYIRGVNFKKKVEKRVEIEIDSIKRSKTPEITKMAMKIGRDPSKTFDRLYPIHKLNKLVKKKEDIDDDDDEMTLRVYRKVQSVNNLFFNFTPKLNENSIKLAEKHGSGWKRLLSKKKTNNIKATDRTLDKTILNTDDKLSDQLINPHLIKIYKKIESEDNNSQIRSKLNKLYTERAKSIIHKKEEELRTKNENHNILENENAKEDNFWKKYNSNIVNSKNIISSRALFDKQEMWKKTLISRNEKLKTKLIVEEELDCTFKPELKSKDLKDDDEFIKKNINQIIKYVSNRKKCLENQRSRKEMIRKRFAFGEDFVFRKTIPKEFEFNKKHEKNYSINVVKMRDMNSEVKEFFDGFISL